MISPHQSFVENDTELSTEELIREELCIFGLNENEEEQEA